MVKKVFWKHVIFLSTSFLTYFEIVIHACLLIARHKIDKMSKKMKGKLLCQSSDDVMRQWDTQAGISCQQAMEFTDSHYCKTSRMHLKFLGQWLYQNPSKRRIRVFFVYAAGVVIFSSLFAKFARSFRELNMFEAIPPTITGLVCVAKLNALNFNGKKLGYLQKQINDDWKERTAPDEIKIMERYASEGRILSIAYMYIIFMVLTVYVMFIFEPCVLDIISPLNETRPLKSLLPAEFFVDEQEYFALITVISILVCFFIIIILVAFDTMLITYVQYICGMLAVVGLIDLLDSTFTICQLVVLGLNVLCLTITLVRTVMLLGSFEMCRYALYAFGQLLHIFYVSYQSERLIDHTLSITKKIYYGNWYTVPKETQRVLLFMLMRSSKPSYITAGKIFVYSMQNFSMVVQNCISYFMVLASFQ